MATDLYMALQLDKEELAGKVIVIAEKSGSNANFVLSAMMCYCIENNIPICLLASHNTFGHYHNVCIKMGVNLLKLKEEGLVRCYDVMKMVETFSNESLIFGKEKEELLMKNLFENIRAAAEQLFDAHHKYPCIILDDVADFLVLGCNPSLVMSFFQYCRCLLFEIAECSLVCVCHTGENDTDSLKVIAGLSHACNIKLDISGLNTGMSGEVSGVLKVDKKACDYKCRRHRKLYHFKLEDRRIVLFPPGTSTAFV